MRCFDIFAATFQMAYRLYCYAGSLYLQDERSVDWCMACREGVKCFEIWPTAPQYRLTQKYMYGGNEIC